MKVSVVHRLALVALSGLALASAGFGSCGDLGSSYYSADGGAGGSDATGGDTGGGEGSSDLGSPSFDAGYLSSPEVVLSGPAPLTSNVKLDTSFDFVATLPSGTPQDLEPYVAIIPRGESTPLNGAFSWKQQLGGGTWSISFTPTGLTDDTDYLVRVSSPKGGELVHTGVSTGSHPRVTRVSLTGKDMASEVYFELGFSEAMDLASLVSAVSVTAGLPEVATTCAGTLTALGSDGASFRYTLGHGKDLPLPLTLHVGQKAVAAAGGALDPASWDSPTVDDAGDFFLDFDALTLDAEPGLTSVEWSPLVD